MKAILINTWVENSDVYDVSAFLQDALAFVGNFYVYKLPILRCVVAGIRAHL